MFDLLRNHYQKRDEKEDFRVAYQAIPQMISQESPKVWTSISVFAVISIPIFGTAISPLIVSERSYSSELQVIGVIASFLGVIISIFWMLMIMRMNRLVEYWLYAWKEVEQKLADTLSVCERASLFADNKNVIVAGKDIQYKCLERIRVRTVLSMMLSIVAIIYLILGIFNCMLLN